MTPESDFFLTESVRHARSLPHAEMLAYLGGLSQSTDSDPAFEPVRAIYRNLTQCEDQLELIASGQLRLDLADHEATTKATKRRKS